MSQLPTTFGSVSARDSLPTESSVESSSESAVDLPRRAYMPFGSQALNDRLTTESASESLSRSVVGRDMPIVDDADEPAPLMALNLFTRCGGKEGSRPFDDDISEGAAEATLAEADALVDALCRR